MTFEIIDLELTPQLIEEQIIEYVKFNPESREASLKLNGIHNGIPAFIFPISFDKDHNIEDDCIESVEAELIRCEELESFERNTILTVLTDYKNKVLMLESIRDYYRDKLHQEQQEQQPIVVEEYDSVSATLRMHDGTVPNERYDNRHIQAIQGNIQSNLIL